MQVLTVQSAWTVSKLTVNYKTHMRPSIKFLGGEKECLGQFQGWDKFIQRAVSDKRATAYIEMGEVTYPILSHNVYK